MTLANPRLRYRNPIGQRYNAPKPAVGDAPHPGGQPGPGSYRLLEWVARLGTAGIEPVSLALGMSQGMAYSHTRRLVKAGLLLRVAINDGGGGAVAITRRGATHARTNDIDAVTPRSQAPTTGTHARAVSWVAARAEQKGCQWYGPPELRHDRLAAAPRRRGVPPARPWHRL